MSTVLVRSEVWLSVHLVLPPLPPLLELIAHLLALLGRYGTYALADALAYVAAHAFARRGLARREAPIALRSRRPGLGHLAWTLAALELTMKSARRLTALVLHPALEQPGMRVRKALRRRPVPHAALGRRRMFAASRAWPHALMRWRWPPRRYDIG